MALSQTKSLLRIIDRAGQDAGRHVEHPDLWLGQAARMMTTELPSTKVSGYICGIIYVHHGSSLSRLGRLSGAIDAVQKVVSNSCAPSSAARGREVLFRALGNLGKYI
jgi:hypothetical protein